MSSADSPELTVLVPALNEQDTIREVVERLLKVPVRTQIVVINDGSTDGTAEILHAFRGQIEVVTNPRPSGKGMAIRKGLEVARGQFVLIQDADLEYFPEQIPALVDKLREGNGVVYGTRFAHGLPKGMALPNKIVNKMLAWATRLLFRQRITDEATCYKAVRTDLLRKMNLECRGFEFCPEVTAKVSRMGFSIVEVPIEYVPRNKREGKKIRWTDAPIAFWTLLRYRFWRP